MVPNFVLIYADENNGVVIPEDHNSDEVENLDKAPEEGTYHVTRLLHSIHKTKFICLYIIL